MKIKLQVFVYFISFLSTIFPAGGQIENAVIIVGNNRAPGTVLRNISTIVGQDNADFTYVAAFPDKRVVSIDTQPCATNDEHIKDDFTITQAFALNSQDTVILEWFPPSSKYTITDIKIPHPMTEALKKAFEILKPGGRLIIENHPFFALAQEQEIARQSRNPFALVLGTAEYLQIYNTLCDNEISQTPSLFSQPACLKSIALTQKIFATEETIIIHTLRNLIMNAINILQQNKTNMLLESVVNSPMGYIFLWGYHTFSRSTIIGNCLKKIGFDIGESQVEFTTENPFNKRKWACLIQAVKPSALA